MSTTINIIPVNTKDITFGQVILHSQQHIARYLQSIGVTRPKNRTGVYWNHLIQKYIIVVETIWEKTITNLWTGLRSSEHELLTQRYA
jgi:hypothetical protein